MQFDDIKGKYQKLLNSITDIKKTLLADESESIKKFRDIHKSIVDELKQLKPEPDPDLEPMIREILKELEITNHIISKRKNDVMEHLNTETKKKKMINAYVKG